MHMFSIKLNKKALRIKDCKGLASLRGLMFNDMKRCDGAIIYGNSIWMPFVKHDLDLIFLDGNSKVTEIQHAVPITLNPGTWRIYKNGKAARCLEVKSGVIRNLKALAGKKIRLGS